MSYTFFPPTFPSLTVGTKRKRTLEQDKQLRESIDARKLKMAKKSTVVRQCKNVQINIRYNVNGVDCRSSSIVKIKYNTKCTIKIQVPSL